MYVPKEGEREQVYYVLNIRLAQDVLFLLFFINNQTMQNLNESLTYLHGANRLRYRPPLGRGTPMQSSMTGGRSLPPSLLGCVMGKWNLWDGNDGAVARVGPTNMHLSNCGMCFLIILYQFRLTRVLPTFDV